MALLSCVSHLGILRGDVQLYDSGIEKDKSLALEPKFRAKKGRYKTIINYEFQFRDLRGHN